MYRARRGLVPQAEIDGRLIYAGPVGTGWSIQLGRSVMAKLQRIGHETSPFVTMPRLDAKDAHWAEPQLVCEVEFTTWTRECAIRRSRGCARWCHPQKAS